LGCCYPTPGYTNELLRIWACRVSGRTEQALDPDEFLEVERIPLEKALEMVMSNEIPDAKSQIGVLKTAMLVKEGKL
jgi:ADP-ribose pyrophosphatase